jgi:glycosyltransferase involved in cell wall biosynthesis
VSEYRPYVIVPVYNEVKLLPKLLERLLEIQRMSPFGLVLCDNNSTDGTRELIEDFLKSNPQPNWHMIEERQQGTGHAIDSAARYAIKEGATHLLRTDADSLPMPEWTQLYEQAFQGSDRLVLGRVTARGDEGLSPVRKRVLNGTYELLRLGARFYYMRSKDQQQPYLGPHMMPTGGNMGITSELYEQAGGFVRGSISTAHEDLQLLLAVRRITRDYRYEPKIIAEQSARRLQAWGIPRTIGWYTEHMWRPKNGGSVDVR